MGTPQENFDKGVEFRLAGNEAFKKQNFKDGLYDTCPTLRERTNHLK
jgi:hypothetical protein